MSLFAYLKAAFNARPLGMPIPPNWFGLAAFGLLGWFVSPGFWVLGAGIELAYLYWLARNPRFRATLARPGPQGDGAEKHYRELLDGLSEPQRARQQQIEARAREVLALLSRSPLMAAHADSLEQLVWLNLRLLAARQALAGVVETAQAESRELQQQETRVDQRLGDPALSTELRRSLEQQKAVIDARQAAHAEARRRFEHVESELQRIGQQIALIREQALLATDEEHIARALDALAASFNEASHWLNDQRDLLGVLDSHDLQRLPEAVLRGPASGPRQARAEQQ